MSSDVVRWFFGCGQKDFHQHNQYYNRTRTITTNGITIMLIILINLIINLVYCVNAMDVIVDNKNLDNNNNNNNNNRKFNSYNNNEIIDIEPPTFSGHYTSTWAVHIPNGGDKTADQVAADHGFINLGKIVDEYYHFHHNSVQKRSISNSDYHQNRLNDDERVRWSEQQIAKSRRKRDFMRLRPKTVYTTEILNDPKWGQMWYLNRGNGLDMNVIPAWREGITGKGIVVTILDDGLESDHPDLEHNYDPKASYDVNGHDDDPMPHYDMTDSNRHGTRCAGEVAATANNSLCAVGIAFGAKVGGVRMLDGDVTDAVEARSLSLNPQHIDIYSASWGPDDDGKTVDGPSEMATRAFIEGVTKGRNGKGSIFIWASGNGGREYDNCNCDGYTNSIWTLSISSATEEGYIPWYSEKCSSTLATTYSSGGQGEKQVVTTDLHHTCTVSHTGTSASAPLAAGIAALVLEANRNLTWRDLQHIVVRTAKPGNLKDETWITNGVGRLVSHSFGYGLMDAAAMVRLAKIWKTVPEQQRCEINAPHLDKSIPPKGHITLQLTVQHCKGVNFLEHVQAKISLQSQRRGDIQIYLKSPSGTKVTLLTSRSHDVSRAGFTQWPFMSVHTWGEAPHGNWQLEIQNDGRYLAKLIQWDLIFYGTEKPPQKTDLPYQGKPFLDNNYAGGGGEFEQNSLLDSETPSGQWREMQQVGESHVDVQRTTSNDQTGSACLHFAPDQKCIECLPNTFLYEGRCYTSCPERSFMMAEFPSKKSSSKSVIPLLSLRRRIAERFLAKKIQQQQQQQKGLSFREQRSIMENSQSIQELPPNEQQQQQQSEPAESQRDSDQQNQPMEKHLPQKYCSTCHYSCLRCHGPNDYDCTECAPDAKIFIEQKSNESYCLSIGSVSSSSSSSSSMLNNQTIITTKFLSNSLTHLNYRNIGISIGIICLIILLGMITVWLLQNHCHLCNNKKDIDYMRVSSSDIPVNELQLSNVRESTKQIINEQHHDQEDDDEDEDEVYSSVINNKNKITNF